MASVSILAVLMALPGCGKRKEYVEVSVYPASGRLRINGEPAEGAYIVFHSVGDVGLTKGNKPFAHVGKDGRYDVTTYVTGDGAPAGKYKVTIVWPENPDARGPSPDRLKGRYAKPEVSGLSVTINESNTLLPDWDLK